MKETNYVCAVEIVSDLICPWCFIGKRRFEQALKAIDFADRIKVSWRPFQLNPDMPKEGLDRKQYRTMKFGSWERSQERDAQVVQSGLEVGIKFNYAIVEKTPNTFLGHRLIWYAEQHGKQDAVVEGLFNAYFCDGLDIGQQTNLLKVAVGAGLEEGSTKDFLISTAGTTEVQTEEARSKNFGVNGVPAFMFNGELAFSGAQDPETIVKHLKEAAKQAV
jgi:predicted DsbA family dithiol-disulfide isomerase